MELTLHWVFWTFNWVPSHTQTGLGMRGGPVNLTGSARPPNPLVAPRRPKPVWVRVAALVFASLQIQTGLGPRGLALIIAPRRPKPVWVRVAALVFASLRPKPVWVRVAALVFASLQIQTGLGPRGLALIIAPRRPKPVWVREAALVFASLQIQTGLGPRGLAHCSDCDKLKSATLTDVPADTSRSKAGLRQRHLVVPDPGRIQKVLAGSATACH